MRICAEIFRGTEFNSERACSSKEKNKTPAQQSYEKQITKREMCRQRSNHTAQAHSDKQMNTPYACVLSGYVMHRSTHIR